MTFIKDNSKQHENLKKGLFYGIMLNFLVGVQPIIANTRPAELDSFMFAAMTCIVEALIFFPLMKIERKSFKLLKKNNPDKNQELDSLLNGWKRHKRLLIYIGFNFGIAQILFFVAFHIAGSINGSLAQKSSIIFSLLFGYLINKEQISKSQILISFFLLFGLTLAITEGSFNLLEFNLGVFIMFITVILWFLAHALTKPVLVNKDTTSFQLVFIRNSIGGAFLFGTYFIFYPIKNVSFFFNTVNIVYFILMGLDYGFDLFCWYKLLSFVSVSKAAVISSPTPIVTAIFAVFLGEIFTIYHLIGLVIIMFSIYLIVREKKEEPSRK